ncbi:hypothetical protein [Caballeronia pedi]|uniref:hypothetical protein n=1 Tax=Caballeronia pedi TaxID=1777141 RepID=UPI00135A7664|nr:hypothetical protein [Caballeronia pedi]
MKKNIKQIDRVEGQRAMIRSTGTSDPSQDSIEPMHERRLRPIDVRDARASHVC